MKKLIFILIISLSANYTRAQTYYPFPDSNAVWNFHFHVTCPFGMEADYSIMISGDTIFNNLNYKKLYTPHIQLALGSSPCSFIESNYRGAFRQDISTKKVYIVSKYLSTEELYFDFNWNVGDTIVGYLQQPGLPSTITLIDSVLIGNSYRKRWFFNDCAPTFVIEGIGAVYGLIEPYYGCLTDQPYFNLTCFKQNGEVLYPDTNTTCNAIIVSSGELNNLYKNFNIFPNPVSDEIYILFNIDKPAHIELQLINSLGQKIKSITTDKLNTGENKINIPVEDVSEGIYFLKVRIYGNEIVKKIISIK